MGRVFNSHEKGDTPHVCNPQALRNEDPFTVELSKPEADALAVVRMAERTCGVLADEALPAELWLFLRSTREPEVVAAYLYGALVLGLDKDGGLSLAS